MPKSAPPRRPMGRPRSQVGLERHEIGRAKETVDRHHQMTPTQRTAAMDPNFPSGPHGMRQVHGIGPESHAVSQADWIGAHPKSQMSSNAAHIPHIGGPSNRFIRNTKWGLGGAVGLSAAEVARRHHNGNRKAKKMDFGKAEDLPFKTRSISPIMGARKPGQKPFTEHYTNSHASPKTTRLFKTGRRKTGASGTLVHVTKKDNKVGFMDRRRHYRKVKPYHTTLKEIVQDEAKWGGAGAVAGGLAGLAMSRTSGGRRAVAEGAKRRFLAANMAVPGATIGAVVGGNKRLVQDSNDRHKRVEARYGHDRKGNKINKADLPITRVKRIQPRTTQGRFSNHATDLQVFHPNLKATRRSPRGTTLGHYTRVKKDLFGGGVETTLALTGTMGMSAFAANQGRRGVNINKGLMPRRAPKVSSLERLSQHTGHAARSKASTADYRSALTRAEPGKELAWRKAHPQPKF